MAKNNFDDFLLDPSYDDLDSVHLEAERQLLRNGGKVKKFLKKVKNKLTKKGKKGSTKTTDAQHKEIEKIASTNPKGSQQMGKPTKDDAPKNDSKKYKPGDKIDAAKPKADKSKIVKPPTVKKTIVKTKRGTGKTYKMAWDDMSAEKKAKYKGGYAEFEKAAKDWNRNQDAVKKAKSISPEQRKKNQNDAMDKHNKRVESAINKYAKPVVGDEVTVTKKDSDRNEFYSNSTSIRRGETKVKEIKKKGTGGKKKLYRGGGKRTY